MVDQQRLIIYGLGGGGLVALLCFIALTTLLIRKRRNKKRYSTENNFLLLWKFQFGTLSICCDCYLHFNCIYNFSFSEALFGSTIKISSYSTGSIIPTSFYIQPKVKEGIDAESSSETDLSKIDLAENQNGLSGYAYVNLPGIILITVFIINDCECVSSQCKLLLSCCFLCVS